MDFHFPRKSASFSFSFSLSFQWIVWESLRWWWWRWLLSLCWFPPSFLSNEKFCLDDRWWWRWLLSLLSLFLTITFYCPFDSNPNSPNFNFQWCWGLWSTFLSLSPSNYWLIVIQICGLPKCVFTLDYKILI